VRGLKSLCRGSPKAPLQPPSGLYHVTRRLVNELLGDVSPRRKGMQDAVDHSTGAARPKVERVLRSPRERRHLPLFRPAIQVQAMLCAVNLTSRPPDAIPRIDTAPAFQPIPADLVRRFSETPMPTSFIYLTSESRHRAQRGRTGFGWPDIVLLAGTELERKRRYVLRSQLLSMSSADAASVVGASGGRQRHARHVQRRLV
jgi:hypothetical protein